MRYEKRVRLLRRRGVQIVHIPREVELGGDEVTLRKEGDRLILEPKNTRSLLAVLASLNPIEADFSEINDPTPEGLQVENWLR